MRPASCFEAPPFGLGLAAQATQPQKAAEQRRFWLLEAAFGASNPIEP